MTINKQKLISQLKDFLGDVNAPDDQEIDYTDSQVNFYLVLRDALDNDEINNQVNFEMVVTEDGTEWQAVYYSSLQKNIILNYDDPTEFYTIEELADWITECNQEAKQLETLINRK